VFWLSLLGRTIFGIGGESMSVAQSAFVVSWFKGKELALAFGLNTSAARLGSVLCSNTVPYFIENYNLSFVLLCGFAICIFSTLNGVGISILDKINDKIINK
jgi:MFS family permease